MWKTQSDERRLEIIAEFEEVTKNAEDVQQNLLARILNENRETEYLRRFGTTTTIEVSSFKKLVPVVGYSDIEADIERIADGDNSPILTASPVLQFSLSSGTSIGRSKMIPVTHHTFTTGQRCYSVAIAIKERAFPLKSRRCPLSFGYAGKQFETKGGLKAGASSTNYYRSPAFKHREERSFISPDDVILGSDPRQVLYCHLLCGLLRRDEVNYITATFAFSIVEAMRMLEEVWEQLRDDILQGQLNARITESAMRVAVSELLEPNKGLADLITEVCSTSLWSGIMSKLWPNAKYVLTVVTGAMLPYVPIVRHYAGGLPIVGLDYVASESYMGYSLDPKAPAEEIRFTFGPDLAFFEFIPLHEMEELESHATTNYVEGEPVGLTEVQIGGVYEIVVTTFSGLYRFRVGDIVRVTGFHNATPQVEFICRRNAILSVATDKTDEQELQNVVMEASKCLEEAGMELADFTSYADLSSTPGHYVIFWELRKSEAMDSDVLHKCCTLMDRSFNNPYMRGRVAGTIGALELCIVKDQTFLKMLQSAMEHGASAGQYKTPRCVKSERLLGCLKDNVVESHFSPEFPKSLLEAWNPTPHDVGRRREFAL